MVNVHFKMFLLLVKLCCKKQWVDIEIYQMEPILVHNMHKWKDNVAFLTGS